MHYYHVLIATQDAPKTRTLFKDLSEEKLRAHFVVPYLQGKTLVSGNDVIPTNSIRRVIIVSTHHSDSVIRDSINERSQAEIARMNRESRGAIFISPGEGYEPEHILQEGEDVTSIFVTGGPGSVTAPSKLPEWVNNQWVVGVGVTLIATAIIAVLASVF